MEYDHLPWVFFVLDLEPLGTLERKGQQQTREHAQDDHIIACWAGKELQILAIILEKKTENGAYFGGGGGALGSMGLKCLEDDDGGIRRFVVVVVVEEVVRFLAAV